MDHPSNVLDRLPAFNDNLSELFHSANNIYRFSHKDADQENAYILNVLFFGKVNVLCTEHPESNGVAHLRAVLDAALLVNKCPSVVLAALPSLLPDVHMQQLAKAGVQNASQGNVPSFLFHERQRHGLCLIHALNNVLGSRIFTSTDTDQSIVDGCINLWKLTPNSSQTPWGEYTDDAIPRACELIGIEAIVVRPDKQLCVIWDNIKKNKALMGAILLRDGHFTALVRLPSVTGGFIVVDSKDYAPRVWKNDAKIPIYMQKMQSIHVLVSTNPPTCCKSVYLGERLRYAQKFKKQGNDACAFMRSLW